MGVNNRCLLEALISVIVILKFCRISVILISAVDPLLLAAGHEAFLTRVSSEQSSILGRMKDFLGTRESSFFTRYHVTTISVHGAPPAGAIQRRDWTHNRRRQLRIFRLFILLRFQQCTCGIICIETSIIISNGADDPCEDCRRIYFAHSMAMAHAIPCGHAALHGHYRHK